MPLAFTLVPAALFGLVIGSFLNVVAWRLPRGASLVTPGSQCPACETPVRPYDNIPVLSWLLLRGRCRACKAPISARYPLVEAATGVLWIAVTAVHHGDTAMLALGLVLVTFLVPLTLIDLDRQELPFKLMVPMAVTGLGIAIALDPGGLPERLIAMVVAFGFLEAARIAKPGGMGGGDPILAGILGLYLGAAAGPALLLALVAGSVVGGIVIARLGVDAGRKTKIPFGPFLAFGGVVGLLAGAPVVDWYLGTF